MSLSKSEVLAKCQTLRGRVERLEKDSGVFTKAATAANDPLEPSIDGQRDVIAELVARAVDRGKADVRSALLRSPAFLTLMRESAKDPLIQRTLIEATLEAERVAGGPQEEELAEPIGDYDHQAFEEAKERARLLQLGREIVRKSVPAGTDILAYRIAKGHAEQVFAAVQAIADHLARGGKDVSAADVAKMIEGTKREPAPMVDYSLQKSASDKTPVDVRELGTPKRIQNPEIVLNRR